MSAPIETLESELMRDLDQLGDRFVDDSFCGELYRALTNNALRKEGGPEGHMVLSWNRVEELVNELRSRHGQPPLILAQGGGEGDVSDTVGDELNAFGWHWRALNTARHDERHSASVSS